MTELTREVRGVPNAQGEPTPATISEYCQSCSNDCNRKKEEYIYYCSDHSEKLPFKPKVNRKIGMKDRGTRK